MSDTTNDINALLEHLRSEAYRQQIPFGNPDPSRWAVALKKLIADYNALKQRVAELETLSKPVYITHGQRVESIDLRERLVCAVLTRLCADPRYDFPEEAAIAIADRALAAMRKGEADGK